MIDLEHHSSKQSCYYYDWKHGPLHGPFLYTYVPATGIGLNCQDQTSITEVQRNIHIVPVLDVMHCLVLLKAEQTSSRCCLLLTMMLRYGVQSTSIARSSLSLLCIPSHIFHYAREHQQRPTKNMTEPLLLHIHLQRFRPCALSCREASTIMQ